MGLDIFKEDPSELKIRKNDYKKKVDNEIQSKLKNDFYVESLNLLELEEEKKIKKTPITLYLEEEDLRLLKAVSDMKNTTVPKLINNIIKSTVKTTQANLPNDFDIEARVKKYDKENKVKKNQK